MRDHNPANLLDIAGVLHELTRRHGQAPSLSYQTVWKLVVAARIPAQRYKNRGWRIRADLPQAAETLA